VRSVPRANSGYTNRFCNDTIRLSRPDGISDHGIPAAGTNPPFLVGWQFAPDTMTARHVVAILDHLTHVSAFESSKS